MGNEFVIKNGFISQGTSYITNEGKLGIGTPLPSEKLEVSGKTKTTNLQVTYGSSEGYILTALDNQGNVGWLPFNNVNITELAPVISIVSTPISGSTDGDRYLISGGTGIWSGKTNYIAEWLNPDWVYTTGTTDNTVFVTDTLTTYRYDGTNWVPYRGTVILQNGNKLNTSINIGSNDNQDINFRVSGSTKMTITKSGNVGIGTTTPVSLLSVYHTRTSTPMGSTIDAINMGGQYSNTAGQNPKIIIYDDGGSVMGFGGSAGQLDYITPSSSHSHVFYTGTVKRVVLGGDGNNGFNIASPTAKIHVVGSSSTSSNYALKVENSANANLFNVRNDGNSTLNGLNIGKGPSQIVSNVVFGVNALSANTTGDNNFAFGFETLLKNISGDNNVGIGHNVLRQNILGNDNVGIGSQTLLVSLGHQNTAIGAYSLMDLTSGTQNTAVGNQSMLVMTTGTLNTSLGYYTLRSNISGQRNVAVGWNALNSALNSFNVGLGYRAGANITIGEYNTAIGTDTAPTLTSGNYNTIIGRDTGRGITTGSRNTIIGASTLGLDSGLNDTIILAKGDGVIRYICTSSGNTGIGTILPTTKLDILSDTTNDSGLRLRNLTSASPSTNGKPIGVDANGKVVAIENTWQSINADTEIYTESNTDVVATGMTITPPAGTYKVDFNGEYQVIAGNVVALAQLDLQTLYLYLNNLTPTSSHGLTFGSGEILGPGVYTVAGAGSVAGTLTLNGGANDLFVIRVAGAINTGAATTISLTGGATSANVFFVATGGAIGIGANNNIVGNYISNGSAAALGANCVFNGRLLTTGGALAFESGVLTKPTTASVVNMGILETFLCYTNAGNVSNTALAQITGDLGTSSGAVSIFVSSTFNGNIYDNSQQFGNSSNFSLYEGATMVSNSNRLKEIDAYTRDIILSGIATVDGTQAITVRWRTNIGRVYLNNRILTIVKL